MFTVKSQFFLDNLKRMQASFSGASQVSFKITVPPEMIWWYWQEFGTALYAEKGTLPGNEVGYEVRPINSKVLKYYDRRTGDFRLAATAFVYGIPAHHMVTDVLPEIRIAVSNSFIKALKQSGYNLNGLHSYMLNEMMPHIKELVRESFELKLNLPNRPGGKLDVSAAEEFQSKAIIEDTSY